MRDGSVAEVGTYEQLMEHDGAFAKFLKTYLTEHNSDSDSDEEGLCRKNKLHCGSNRERKHLVDA